MYDFLLKTWMENYKLLYNVTDTFFDKGRNDVIKKMNKECI